MMQIKPAAHMYEMDTHIRPEPDIVLEGTIV